MNDKLIKVTDLTKNIDNKVILQNLNFDINKNEFVSIVGPSGCGKTTLLRILLGLEQPTSGRIMKYQQDITNETIAKRKFSVVFQDYALFPHMSAYENIAYGLKIAKLGKTKIQEKVMTALELVKLEGHKDKFPHELSGGQRQRVAIARCFVMDSDLILLDEPFSALDAFVRVQLQDELKQIQRNLGIAMILVTHDQEEAMHLSDRMIVMDQGKIIAHGTPREIYCLNQNTFVNHFIIEQINSKYSNLKDIVSNNDEI